MKTIQNFKNPQKILFQKWKITKIECTAIINTFSRRVVRDSTRFRQRHVRKPAHNPNKIFFGFLSGGNTMKILQNHQDGHENAPNP